MPSRASQSAVGSIAMSYGIPVVADVEVWDSISGWEWFDGPLRYRRVFPNT